MITIAEDLFKFINASNHANLLIYNEKSSGC